MRGKEDDAPYEHAHIFQSYIWLAYHVSKESMTRSPIRHNVINWIESRWDEKREERQIGRRKDKWKKSRKERAKNGWSDRLSESTTGRQTLEMSAWEQRNHLSEIQMWFYVKKKFH